MVSATALGRLTAANYVSTTLTIWQAVGSTPAPDTSVPSIDIGGVDSATLEDPDLLLATVGGISQHLDAGTYFIGFQNNFNSSKGFSTYATTGQSSTVWLGQGEPQFTAARYDQVNFYIYGTYDNTSSGGGAPPPSVPEASNWAMALFGFAGLGWLARRRVRTTRFEFA